MLFVDDYLFHVTANELFDLREVVLSNVAPELKKAVVAEYPL